MYFVYPQGACRIRKAAKPPTAAQYFKIFKPISWGERPAERRSRFIQRFPKLTLRVPLVFTKKQGIYAAKLMLRLRPAFVNRTYYTITPRSGLNKTASIAVLHGSMFSKPCAPAQGRVPCTRAAAPAAALRLLYHVSEPAHTHAFLRK